MEKTSRFRLHILPWILFVTGTACTIAEIVIRCLQRPLLLAPFDTFCLIAAGLAGGLALIIPINKTTKSKRDYFNLKGTMAISWVACLLLMLTIQSMTWVYPFCLVVNCGCVTFFALYIPHYISLKEAVFQSQNETK